MIIKLNVLDTFRRNFVVARFWLPKHIKYGGVYMPAYVSHKPVLDIYYRHVIADVICFGRLKINDTLTTNRTKMESCAKH